MYFKVSGRHNPTTNRPGWYYRLVESYRNPDGRVCHRTMLNVGFLEELSPEQMNLIQKILTARAENQDQKLFEFPVSDDPVVNQYVEAYYARLVSEKRIDAAPAGTKVSRSGKDWQTIDVNSIKNKDVREVGAEWLCFQAIRQLGAGTFLADQGWDGEQVQLALTHIISRAVYPASERKTSSWIKENSAICELTGYNIDKITKDKLYGISQKLYQVKQGLEQYLSLRTNELFGIEEWLGGIIVAIAVFVVIIGGIKSLGSIAEKVVPVMAIAYVLMAMLALALNYQGIPGAFATIFDSAFS
jgi:hypothetical protein